MQRSHCRSRNEPRARSEVTFGISWASPPTARSIDEQLNSACASSCTIMKVNELAHS